MMGCAGLTRARDTGDAPTQTSRYRRRDAGAKCLRERTLRLIDGISALAAVALVVSAVFPSFPAAPEAAFTSGVAGYVAAYAPCTDDAQCALVEHIFQTIERW